MKGKPVFVYLLAASFLLVPISQSLAQTRQNRDHGHFVGRFAAEFLDTDPRKVRLLEPLRFVDLSGRTWTAPAGAVVDGASIPRALWTTVGSPLTGKYRRASVIHDVECEAKLAEWQDVHRVFYDAMLADGVEPRTALLMYGAVYHFGPRWGWKKKPGSAQSIEQIEDKGREPTNTEFKELDAFVRAGNPTLEDVERALRITRKVTPADFGKP